MNVKRQVLKDKCIYKIKNWSKQNWKIDLCGKIGTLMAISIVFYFNGYLEKCIEWAPLLSLSHNIFGTFLIVNAVFSSGERGTSQGYQIVNGEEVRFGMIDPGLVRLGGVYLIVGYVIQIFLEVRKFFA